MTASPCNRHIFYLQHGHGTQGPFRTEEVIALESWMTRPTKRGSVIPCRFVIQYNGRRRRLYADRNANGVPHFIVVNGERIAVTGVCP